VLKLKSGKFTKEETEKLIEMYNKGMKAKDIAKALDRKQKSIENKIQHSIEIRRRRPK
jgi:DNA-binding NarL/FixJ family response regulator